VHSRVHIPANFHGSLENLGIRKTCDPKKKADRRLRLAGGLQSAKQASCGIIGRLASGGQDRISTCELSEKRFDARAKTLSAQRPGDDDAEPGKESHA
jgi:hypothetical protein